MDNAAAFVIAFILGKKSTGKPGRPGWEAFAVPMLEPIDPTFVAEDQMKERHPRFFDLPPQRLRVPSSEISRALQRLTVLLTSHPHPELTSRILRPILLPLWWLSYWPYGNENTELYFRKPAALLLKTYLQLWSGTTSLNMKDKPSPNLLAVILHHITRDPAKTWTYHLDQDGGMEIIEDAPGKAAALKEDGTLDLDRVKIAVAAFVALIQSIPELDSYASELFLDLVKNWLANSVADQDSIVISFKQKAEVEGDNSPLVEALVIEQMRIVRPEKLVEDSSQLLDLVGELVSEFVTRSSKDIPQSENVISITLGLLGIILWSSATARVRREKKDRLESIQKGLEYISKRQDLEVSKDAQNLLRLVKYGDMMDEPAKSDSSTPTGRY